jgi:hypothetical protein
MQGRRFEQEPPTPEESFEDVGLNDEQKPQQPVKKRGFFTRFGGDGNQEAQSGNLATVSRFVPFHSRKRGQSGQGAELGQMERPKTATSVEAQEVPVIQVA